MTVSSSILDSYDISTNDEFLKLLPKFYGSRPMLSIPTNENTLTDYRSVSATEFNQWIDSAATLLSKRGLPPVPLKNRNTKKVGVCLLLPSGFELMINQFALTRLGYTPLLTSTRLSGEIVLNMLKGMNSNVMVTKGLDSIVNACKRLRPNVELISPASFEEFSVLENIEKAQDFSASHVESKDLLKDRCCCFLHSSGSTGFPKLITMSNRTVLNSIKFNFSKGNTLITVPLFHLLGFLYVVTTFGTISTVFLSNYNLPVTGNNAVESILGLGIDHLICVPYILMMLFEAEKGNEAIQSLKLISYGGANLPESIGNKIVSLGTQIQSVYGSSEFGGSMTSYKCIYNEWNWLSIIPSLRDCTTFVDQGDGTYEFCLLPNCPYISVRNTEDGGFNTRDLFTKHPKHNWYKFEGRKDDRVTLSTGEKVLTVPIENEIRSHPLVKDCVIFGIGKEVPGAFIIPNCIGKPEEEILNELWPVFQETNKKVEQFSHIMRGMIKILRADTEYPMTMKGNIQRNLFYKKFEAEIEEVYKNAEEEFSIDDNKIKAMSLKDIEDYILKIFIDIGHPIVSTSTNLYKEGIDSLQAITVWGHIHRELTRKVNRNVVYDYSNIEKLSQHVYDLTHDNVSAKSSSQTSEDVVVSIQTLIDKYSDFSAYSNLKEKDNSDDNEYILLTGSTGSLGAFTLERLLKNKKVVKVYCIVRANNTKDGMERILKSFEARKINRPTSSELEKVSPIPFDVSMSTEINYNLERTLLFYAPDSTRHLTSVVHIAWPVNFNYGLEFFEPHIKFVSDLVKLCLSSKMEAKLVFCSSISTALACPSPIPESTINNLSRSAVMGYGKSKLVCEHILKNACAQTGIFARSARIGQIVGDSKNGIWNSTEAFPLIIQSVKILKALPALHKSLSWTPVDVVADVLLDILFSGEVKEKSQGIYSPEVVYNVTTPKLFSWTNDLLPALKKDAGLQFEVVKVNEWLKRLEGSTNNPKVNPTIKLLDHYKKLYGQGNDFLIPEFITKSTELVSPSLKEFDDVISSGLVTKFVRGWNM